MKFIMLTHLNFSARHEGLKLGIPYMVQSEETRAGIINYKIKSEHTKRHQVPRHIVVSEGHCCVISGEEAKLARLLYEV